MTLFVRDAYLNLRVTKNIKDDRAKTNKKKMAKLNERKDKKQKNANFVIINFHHIRSVCYFLITKSTIEQKPQTNGEKNFFVFIVLSAIVICSVCYSLSFV